MLYVKLADNYKIDKIAAEDLRASLDEHHTFILLDKDGEALTEPTSVYCNEQDQLVAVGMRENDKFESSFYPVLCLLKINKWRAIRIFLCSKEDVETYIGQSGYETDIPTWYDAYNAYPEDRIFEDDLIININSAKNCNLNMEFE